MLLSYESLFIKHKFVFIYSIYDMHGITNVIIIIIIYYITFLFLL